MKVATILVSACRPSSSNKQHHVTPPRVLPHESLPSLTHPQHYIPQEVTVITHLYPVPHFLQSTTISHAQLRSA